MLYMCMLYMCMLEVAAKERRMCMLEVAGKEPAGTQCLFKHLRRTCPLSESMCGGCSPTLVLLAYTRAARLHSC